ncbi:MAG: alpha/beta hydrolase-fold protein [Bacteroidota bacterium]
MADSLIRVALIEPVIIVGIASTKRRSYEYGPFPEGEQYMNFMTQTLKPFIDQTYRTLPDREHTATWGASMGGLIAFMLAWEKNETFSKAACFSPAFQFSFKRELIDYPETVETYTGAPKDLAIYIDNGTLGVDDMLQLGVDTMMLTLKQKNYDFEWFFADGADHNEAAWSKRVWRPLTQFFAK